MYDLPLPNNVMDRNLEQFAARAFYFHLRDKLVSLNSASVPNQVAIDAVIQDLEKAQMAYKASHGVYGNNPNNSPAMPTA
jgi:hypothetical protein